MAAHQQALSTRTPTPLGDRLFSWLLDALTPPIGRQEDAPPSPLQLDLSLGGPEDGLTLCCDATADRHPTPPGSGRSAADGEVVSIPAGGVPAQGPLDDFLAALMRGPTRGVIFRATGVPRAVFRGEIGGHRVRLSVRAWRPGRRRRTAGGTARTARLA